MSHRLHDAHARHRLIDNIAGGLSQVTKPDVVERSIEHFAKADAEYGQRLKEAVAKARG